MFAIARISKIKSLKEARVASSHNARTDPRFSKEIDASRTHLNLMLIGSESPYNDIVSALPEKRRKNAVLAVEALLTASPEYFRNQGQSLGQWNEEKLNAWLEPAIEFSKKHWGDNLVNMALHLDEATPHLQLFIIPKRPDGKLDARSLFNKQALIKMQNEYHSAVAHLGLSRGLSATLTHREHEPLKEYYKRANEPVIFPELMKRPAHEKTLEVTGILGQVSATKANRIITDLEDVIEKTAQAHTRVSATARDQAKRAKAKDDAAKKAKADYARAAREAERLRDALEASKAHSRELTNRLREISLEAVLERLNAIQSNNDARTWMTEAGELTIGKNGDARFNSLANKELKGRGAIDLVSKVLGYDFKNSVKWLSDNFGSEQAIASAVTRAAQQAEQIIEKTPSPGLLPEPAQEHWPHVRHWLVSFRKLSEQIIDALHARGEVYADRHRNAVFASQDQTAAELMGTGEKAFRGLRGDKTTMFAVGQLGRIAVVASAIDAIRLMESGQFTGAISTAGAPSAEQFAKIRTFQSEKIIAFNDDEAGDYFASEAAEWGLNQRMNTTPKDPNNDKSMSLSNPTG